MVIVLRPSSYATDAPETTVIISLNDCSTPVLPNAQSRPVGPIGPVTHTPVGPIGPVGHIGPSGPVGPTHARPSL